MRSIVIAAALTLSLAVPDLVAAQGGAASGARPPAAGQSPVGHRQPKATEVPPTDQRASSDNPGTTTDMDRALDKALKGICRGC
ncbi:MAG TPA: hypothetical protein VEM36_13565 [Xanthobacteraceae bacterium]|nr:hypothetical protein [Xanthobacteraceae bacterium]